MPRAQIGGEQKAEAPKKRAEARDFSVYHNDNQKVGGRKTPPKSSGGGGCCGLFAKREPPFEQTIVLLRHSERVDYVDQNYPNTAEGKKWPHDAPLTTRGHELAADVARSLRSLHEKAHFSAVATSPYRRCLETSAAVARELHLPVIVDQELGEVWDRQMPQKPNPFRPNDQLRPLIESLKIKDANPSLEDGSLKLFGKPPKWPESLDDAKTRYLVRIEEYIEQSMLNSRNYILVTHADAVAAALQMFEHGNSDVQNLDFCARCIASRKVPRSRDSRTIDDSAYKDKWEITTEGVKQETMAVDKKLEKYYEKQHMENVEEKQEAAARRKANRTKTDAAFGERMKAFAEEADEDEAMSSQEKSPPPSPKVAANPASSTSKSKDQQSTASSTSRSKDQQRLESPKSKDQQSSMSSTSRSKDQQRPESPPTSKSKDQQSIASSTSKSKDQQSSRSKETRGNARV